MNKDSDSIYIRNIPPGFIKRTNKILGHKLAGNGKKFTRNDIYHLIYERGLLALEKDIK